MKQQAFLFNNSKESTEKKEKKIKRIHNVAQYEAEVEKVLKEVGVKQQEDKKPKIYSVSDVVGFAKGLLEKCLSKVWVNGEISGFKKHSSGHCYFTLKDSNSVLPAAIFRGAASHLKFEPEDGQEVLCYGNVSLYQKGGYYQIIVTHLEPKGMGALQLAFEQLKKKLQAEGLFDTSRKRKLPMLPRKIGIITSPTGAAVRDILKVLKRRFSNVEVLVVPARVQGEGSAREIAKAIELLNTVNDVDVMIVGRGGGSLEDLWAFNEEIVARAIYNSKIPVISAVGHEVDFTIADFVADFRAPTPSAAAEIAIPVKDELLQYLNKEKRQLYVELKRNISLRIDKIRELKQRLAKPTKSFPDHYRYIDSLKERIIYSSQVLVNKRENVLKGLEAELNHLSPLSVLSKGYSVAMLKDRSRVIRTTEEIKERDQLITRFSKGEALLEVIKILD